MNTSKVFSYGTLSHSFTCTPHIHPLTLWTIPAFVKQITTKRHRLWRWTNLQCKLQNHTEREYRVNKFTWALLIVLLKDDRLLNSTMEGGKQFQMRVILSVEKWHLRTKGTSVRRLKGPHPCPYSLHYATFCVTWFVSTDEHRMVPLEGGSKMQQGLFPSKISLHLKSLLQSYFVGILSATKL